MTATIKQMATGKKYQAHKREQKKNREREREIVNNSNGILQMRKGEVTGNRVDMHTYFMP